MKETIKITYKYPITGYTETVEKTIEYDNNRSVALANLFLDPIEFGYVEVIDIKTIKIME